MDSLFFVFYYQPGTYQQYLAAKQLKKVIALLIFMFQYQHLFLAFMAIPQEVHDLVSTTRGAKSF
jgi:hypothetical protein